MMTLMPCSKLGVYTSKGYALRLLSGHAERANQHSRLERCRCMNFLRCGAEVQSHVTGIPRERVHKFAEQH